MCSWAPCQVTCQAFNTCSKAAALQPSLRHRALRGAEADWAKCVGAVWRPSLGSCLSRVPAQLQASLLVAASVAHHGLQQLP